MIKIINVAGARPNFIKIAPLQKELAKYKRFQTILVHTGQHYDDSLSKIFFKELKIPNPDINLGVGSGTHAAQTAKIMLRFEKVLEKEKPHLVLVVGDVNSTLACSLVTAKMGIPIAHVEAGLRSFDRTMPEEINRLVTDSLADFLFTTSDDANKNLLREGIAKEKIFLVGNVMIDTLLRYQKKAINSQVLNKLGLKKKEYVVLTLHRPSSVDERHNLIKILKALEEIQRHLKIIFPAHPRTKKNIRKLGLTARIDQMENLIMIPPLGYLDFLALMSQARFVMTDSGGIQAETTVLKISCLTLRENTENPITIEKGTNQLVGTNSDQIIKASQKILQTRQRKIQSPPLWDGHAAGRIIQILNDRL